MSEQEMDYSIERRYRRNIVPDGSAEYPDPPNWGEWSEWWNIGRRYPTLAGAAMAHAASRNGVERTYREPKRAVAEYQNRVVYRKVTKTWTPLLPDLEEE